MTAWNTLASVSLTIRLKTVCFQVPEDATGKYAEAFYKHRKSVP